MVERTRIHAPEHSRPAAYAASATTPHRRVVLPHARPGSSTALTSEGAMS